MTVIDRVERSRRWRGGVAAAVVLVLAGIADQDPALLLAAVIPLVYVGYGAVSTVTVPEELRVTRTVDPTPAPPGSPVTVRLRVENESAVTLSDLRVVDMVHDDLAVMDGTPRGGGSLEPGDSLTVEYALVARRGEYPFEPVRVRIRGLGGGAVATAHVEAEGDAAVDCRLDADAPPLYDQGDQFVGQLAADDSGQGVAFHSTREYRPDDPASRINWRQYAKRGTLATVNYERHVSATVIAVIDARAACHVVPGPGRPTAVELEAYAATRAVTAFLRGGHDVGVAVIGCDGPGPGGLYWLPPTGTGGQRARALDLFRTATESDGESEADPNAQVRKLAELAPPGAQLALFSPVLDDLPVSAVNAWSAYDHPTVVLSPDVISANTVSGQFAQVERRRRLAACQAAGARAFDWRRGTPLALALEYAFATSARVDQALAGKAATGGRS